jgi:two-component system KDP operon response regulator KdpE
MTDRRTILLVEDDEDTSFALGIRLNANGYTTRSATDVDSALAAVASDRPDLILLDLGLPGGGGLAVLERLRDDAGRIPIPVIVLSARPAATAREAALAAGASAFIEKLVDNRDLLTAIASVLEEERPEA